MIKGEDQRSGRSAGAAPTVGGALPYVVELWNLPRTAPERILGRAASAPLARSIFTAAKVEHLGRRILLRRGSQVLEASD
ncbi:MAG TPA: hypothetical protein VIO94_16690 [Phenylobacterium sp.]